MSVSSRIYNLYSLPKSHAYTPLGTCEHEYENGTLVRLVKVTNFFIKFKFKDVESLGIRSIFWPIQW